MAMSRLKNIPLTMAYLYSEEQMPNLVNCLWITCRFSSRETLEGGKHKIRWVLEVKDSLYSIEIVGRNVREFTIFDCHTPLTTPLTINLDPYYSIYTFRHFLVNSRLHENKHIRHEYTSSAFV